MIAATNNASAPYQQGEQEKKAAAMKQPQGAQAPQPNAQAQTFATLQQQGYARPAAPSAQPQQQAQQQVQGQYAQASNNQMSNSQGMPFQNGGATPEAPKGQYAQYNGGQMSNSQGMPQGQTAQYGGPMMASNTGEMTNGQGMMSNETPPVQNGYNGFNGQAPNYNPLDFMVGQMMQPAQQTNFGQLAGQTQFQGYTPTQAPQFQGAGTNYGQGGGAYGNISVQGGGGGVASNYSGSDLNPYSVGQFTNQGGPVADATQQKMLDILQKPSGWDSDLVKNMYAQQGAGIDDQFQAQDTAINEEMARRGLYDSSIAGGRLKDSNLQKRDAKTNLADSLLQQMGLNYGNDQARAASLGAGYQGQQFGESAQTFGLNQGAEQQAFGQRLGAEQAKQGAFGLNQQGQIANSNAGIASMNANLQAQQANQQNAFNYAGLNSSNALANNAQSLDRSRFMSGENQFGTNTANQNAQQRFQNQFQGGQQDFLNRITNQNQARDMNGQIINYGQQQFNNDMTQQQFNANMSQQEWNRLMQTMGLS